MQNFTDSQGRFEFPENLFPEVNGPITVPPSVGLRRAAILRGAVSAAAFLQRAAEFSESATGIPSDIRVQSIDWARSVLQFHTVWSSLPADMVAQAYNVLETLAKRFKDGEASYILGSVSVAAGDSSLSARVSANDRRWYLRQALKANVHRAWYRVGVNSDARGDHESALSRFQRGADRNDSACLYTLGLAYMQGQLGIERDVERGVNLIEMALDGADPDFPRAPYLLGKIMLGEGNKSSNGEGLGIEGVDAVVPLNTVRGLDLVERSAMMGFAPALLRMAEAYLSAERGFDCSVALRYLSLAACQDIYRRFNKRSPVLGGAPEAQIVKWLLCGYENVVRKNEEWAFKFAEVSAIDQNASALFALAYFYEVGIATKPDMSRAMALYNMSSAKGFAAATARLEQLNTGKPQLRRTLTRQDHDAKMRKHYAALMRGEAGAPSAAINDESTFVDGQQLTENEKNGDQRIENSDREKQQPVGENSAPPGFSPPVFDANGKTPESKQRDAEEHEGQGGKSILPYPAASSPEVQPVEPSISVLPYPTSPSRSPSSAPALPYPPDSPLSSVWQSPQTSPQLSPRTSPKLSTHGSSTSLPYPRSPDHRHSRSLSRSPSPSRRPERAVTGSIRRTTGGPFTGVPAANGTGVRESSPASNVANRGPSSAFSSSSSSLNSARKPVGSAPSTSPSAPLQSSTPLSNNSAASSPSPNPPSLAARQGPALRSVPNLSESLLQTAPNLKPTKSNDSFRTAQGTPEAEIPGERAEASPSPSPQLPAGAQVPHTSGHSQSPSLASFHAPFRSASPASSQVSSKAPSIAPSTAPSQAPSHAPSTGSAEVRSNSPRRRPMSAQWMRQSIVGANRFFSSSQASILAATQSRGSSPAPSITSTSDVASEEQKLRRRSQSPLRKIFGSTPEQRAAIARADRRSFTEAALAELASAPKVPVQPIKTDRLPGVAYTFEEMGVSPVTSDKNDRCVIQ